MARDGEHAAAAWKSVKRTPCEASLSRFGVRISPPKQERSENPRSSATMTRKLGRLSDGIAAVDITFYSGYLGKRLFLFE